jgi:hypothetical protein
MRKSYQKNKSKLVAVIEPLKYRDKPDLLMPKFGVIDVDDEDVSYLVDDELSIEEVYFEVLNEIKSKRQFPIN